MGFENIKPVLSLQKEKEEKESNVVLAKNDHGRIW
jgi:hypothetical protein